MLGYITMVITFQGNQSVKLQFGDTVVAVNPERRSSAAITLFSLVTPEASTEKSFVINGPGEYEINEVFIRGLASSKSNTIYTLTLDSMNVCLLGLISSTDLPAEAKEALEEIDILFLPVGGNGTLSPAEAYKLAVSLEPRLIIPLGYDVPGATKDALKLFLKEAGEQVTPVDKLTVKRKDLEGKEGDVVVLKVQN